MSSRTEMKCIICGVFSSAQTCHSCNESLNKFMEKTFSISGDLSKEEAIKAKIKKFRTLERQRIKNESARLKALSKTNCKIHLFSSRRRG